MSTLIKRVNLALLALAIAFTFMPALDQAYAMNDMSPQGSIAMPADKTLAIPQNTEVKINFGNDAYSSDIFNAYYYFRIKPSKTGYITFTNDYVHGSDVALCNAKKKVISRGEAKFDDFYSANSSYPYQTILHYGVKKGVAYYIRVKGPSTDREDYTKPYIGTVKWTNSAVKNLKYGKTKKKAVALKRKAKRNGLFIAGNKKAQWYKITTKQKNTKVYLSSKTTNGTLYATVYYKLFGKTYNTRTYAMRSDDSGTNHTTISSFNKKKKTYYVKVWPKNTASGSYKLSWK